MQFVKIPGKDFEMSAYQISQGEWLFEMGSNPSYFKNGSSHPVEQVSFYDVQEYIKKLNEKKDGYTYRLPTEEEWEFCCRAGSDAHYCFGNNDKQLGEYAWFYENSDNKTHPVGEKKPNAFGLYDMHGNVWEWCDSFYYKDETEPGSSRVLRGGSWYNSFQGARSAYRYNYSPGDSSLLIGFRLVRTPASVNSQTKYELNENLENIIEAAKAETLGALKNWPKFNSAHEGFAVLKEEVDELWEHVKTNQKKRHIADMKKEAIQIAAMALRFALEVCDEESGRK